MCQCHRVSDTYKPPNIIPITHAEADDLAELEQETRELRQAIETWERLVEARCKRDGLSFDHYNHAAMARQHVAIAVGLLHAGRGGEVAEVSGAVADVAERIRSRMEGGDR
jgi:hypothetical protein